MFARLARYEIDPDRADEAVQSFQQASEGLADIDGFKGGYVLLDDEGSIATLTVWQSRAALMDSQSRAGRLRQEAVQAVGGSVLSVNEYEVAHEMGQSLP
jgi:heme-degrading monooxygenase HmoA